MFRRLRKWWLCRKHGICPIHFTLMIAGGGYEPRWWCEECQKVNGLKHELNLLKHASARHNAIEAVKRLDVRP